MNTPDAEKDTIPRFDLTILDTFSNNPDNFAHHTPSTNQATTIPKRNTYICTQTTT